jgi:hypothetical protein
MTYKNKRMIVEKIMGSPMAAHFDFIFMWANDY